MRRVPVLERGGEVREVPVAELEGELAATEARWGRCHGGGEHVWMPAGAGWRECARCHVQGEVGRAMGGRCPSLPAAIEQLKEAIPQVGDTLCGRRVVRVERPPSCSGWCEDHSGDDHVHVFLELEPLGRIGCTVMVEV